MRLLKRVGVETVVSEWLRAEVVSSRFGPGVQGVLDRDGQDRTVLEQPDLDDVEANAYRLRVLRELRGFGYPDGVDATLLERFPVSRVDWWLAEVGRDELVTVHFIAWDYWLEVTNGSRLPADYVRLLDTEPGREAGADRIAERISRGEHLPLMICVDTGPGTRVVVVEGHLRLTAYVMAGDAAPSNLRVLLGRSPAITQWGNY